MTYNDLAMTDSLTVHARPLATTAGTQTSGPMAPGVTPLILVCYGITAMCRDALAWLNRWNQQLLASAEVSVSLFGVQVRTELLRCDIMVVVAYTKH